MGLPYQIHTIVAPASTAFEDTSLREELRDAGLTHQVYGIRVSGADVEVLVAASVTLTLGDKSAIDAVYGAHDGTNRKEFNRTQYVRIDQRVASKIVSSGFTVAGKVFSTTPLAQANWTMLYSARAVITYPRTYATRANREIVSLVNAAAIEVHFGAMLTAVRSARELADGAKVAVTNAANEATAKAVADAYVSS